jgi:hypothetical protein
LTSYDRAWCDSNATLIYSGSLELYNNTGLDAETTYFYKAFAVYSDDTGTHYSLGVVTNATTGVDPVQEWDVYPDSPLPTSQYPYQLIGHNYYNYKDRMSLNMSTAPLYTRKVSSGHNDVIAQGYVNVIVYVLSLGEWVYFNTYTQTDLQWDWGDLQANHDVYSDPDCTVVYFEKTTS